MSDRVSVGVGGTVAVVDNRNGSCLCFPGSTPALALRLGRGGDLVHFFGRRLSDGVRVVSVEYDLRWLLNKLLQEGLFSVHVHVHM